MLLRLGGFDMSKIYYTEYPRGQFKAENDSEALNKSKALLIYKESETINGLPMIIIREDMKAIDEFEAKQ